MTISLRFVKIIVKKLLNIIRDDKHFVCRYSLYINNFPSSRISLNFSQLYDDKYSA